MRKHKVEWNNVFFFCFFFRYSPTNLSDIWENVYEWLTGCFLYKLMGKTHVQGDVIDLDLTNLTSHRDTFIF